MFSRTPNCFCHHRTLDKIPSITPLDSALTKNRGEGPPGYPTRQQILPKMEFSIKSYFNRPLCGGAETSGGLLRALAVTRESRNWLKRSLTTPGECGTSTVLVRSLAAISLSVSKYWVMST